MTACVLLQERGGALLNKAIFVIVPAYNEGGVIRSTAQPLIDLGYSVVIVDDCSQDGTADALVGLPIYYLRHPVNLGQGAALQTGMRFAVLQGADVVVHFDADGQHQARDVDALVEPILSGQADVVLGSRFLRREDVLEVPFVRRLLLRCAVFVNWGLTGVRLSDAHNGFRAMSAAAAKLINLSENRFAHASEIIVQIRQFRLRFVEKPTTIVYTDYSRAKGQPMWNAISIFSEMLLRRLFK